MDKNDKFGLMVYNCINIGDPVQSLAALRFLPRVDRYVVREQIARGRGKFPVKIILNAWWGAKGGHGNALAKTWPPKSDIIPLLISMHANVTGRKTFAGKKSIEWFRKNGPVGCRDMDSVRFFTKLGVPAYFSGCLTTTLLPNPKIKKKDYILCVNTDDALVQEIKKRAKGRPVFAISKMIGQVGDAHETLEMAAAMLAVIQAAHCVVSPNLHTCMPAVALGAPCLHIIKPTDLGVGGRYEGNSDCWHNITAEEFMANKNAYDFDNPPANPDAYKKIAADLVKKCKEFTGYDSKQSPIKNINPEIALMQAIVWNRDKRNRWPYFIPIPHMLRAIFMRVFLGRKRCDIKIDEYGK